MKKRSFIASFLAGVALLAASLPAVSADTPSIVSVSAPPDSSDLYAWAFDTGIYSIAFPIKDPEHIGIGYIVEPEPFHRTWSPMTDFVMHDHMYVAPGVPDPRRANITYRFDAPAKISEVLIVQHTNGIAQVEGFIGYDEENLKSIGFANSALGANLPLRENTFAEGYRDVFKFERAGEGKVFRVVITKTPLPNGYAVYRVYPRNSDHRPMMFSAPTKASLQNRWQSHSAPHPSMVTLRAICFIGRPMQHDAIRRSVAEGTKRGPLKFTAGNETSGAGRSDNLAVVVHDLSATDSRLRKSGDVHSRIRRVLCIRELLLIL